jgi:hypothetical protein
MGQIRLWKLQQTNEMFGTRGVTRQRLFKADGYASLKNPPSRDSSLEIRTPIVPTRAVATSSRESAG